MCAIRHSRRTPKLDNRRMRFWRAALLCAFAVSSLHAADMRRAVFILNGDPILFNAEYVPQFTENQIRNTDAATREGLARWASTVHGRKLISYFTGNDLQVMVTEDASEEGIGRAPQPGLATLVAAAHHTHVKDFELVLNPRFFHIPDGWVPLPNEPATPSDAMAAAWAGEMLHIWFYARGISLPHHTRADFQDEWRDVAAELGMPSMTHSDDESTSPRRRRAVIRLIQ